MFLKDERNISWCTEEEWDVTRTRAGETRFCPVLKMMELRYTENGVRYARTVQEEM